MWTNHFKERGKPATQGSAVGTGWVYRSTRRAGRLKQRQRVGSSRGDSADPGDRGEKVGLCRMELGFFSESDGKTSEVLNRRLG